MNFDLTEEQVMLRDMVRAWAKDRVAPQAARNDQEHRFPAELVAEMAEMGLLGMAVPEEWGGSGMDVVSYVIAMEEISAACASTGVIMSVNNSLVCDPILRYGTDAQKEQWLKPLAQGKKLGCYALSEPGTGSDAANQTATATRDGDGWILNGTKNWITNGPEADTSVAFFMSDKPKGVHGITGFLVDLHRPGVARGKKEEKMGIRASGTCSLIFEDYRATDDEVLGGVDNGFKVAMGTLDGGRIGIAAQALGIGRAAFEEAAVYAQERRAFGKPIAKMQSIQNMLADTATELDAARLLIWRAAALKDAGKRYGKESAMAKLFAAEASHRAVHKALQIHGGYGYVQEYAVERHYRDQRITEIYEGTSEIQRLVIGRAVLKEAAAHM